MLIQLTHDNLFFLETRYPALRNYFLELYQNTDDEKIYNFLFDLQLSLEKTWH